jgi:membrane protein DedA with SNARE-associated domain
MELDSAITAILEDHGYWGILLLIFVENVFPPIPSEVILTFGGFLTSYGTLKLGLCIASATAGSVIGAFVLYWIGRLLASRKEAGALARFLKMDGEGMSKAKKWFERRGAQTVFFCRFIPIVRSLISVPAGIAKMDQWLFLFYTAAGTLIWNTLLILLGNLSGYAWERIGKYFSIYSRVALTAIAIGGIALLLAWAKKSAKKKAKAKDR